jgi:ParB family chromosome partitioning protein
MPAALAMIRKLTPQQRMEMVAQFAAAALDFQNMPLDQDKDDKFHGPRAICNAIDAKALNAALRGAFDAKDYFAGVSKALCVKAIEEAKGADLARQQSKNPKGDIAKFAIANVPTTGWLPPQLRAKGYDGPPVAKKAVPAAPKTLSPPTRAAITAGKVKAAKAVRAARAASVQMKRAAAAKKAAKKTFKKKR